MIDQALRLLNRGEQQALVMRFYQQKTLPQIASDLGISEEAARKRVTRAISRLQKLLAGKRLAIAPVALALLLETTVAPAPAPPSPPRNLSRPTATRWPGPPSISPPPSIARSTKPC